MLKTLFFYDFGGGDFFTIWFVGVLMNGTDFVTFFCVMPPLPKNRSYRFLNDFFMILSMIGKLGTRNYMKLNDFNTIVYWFLYDLFVGC